MADTTITLEFLAKELKSLRKDIRKIRQHIEDPSGDKAKTRSENNGFNKPLGVSEKLRAFTGIGPEDKISRAQVTRKVNQYVEEKGLKAGQHISLDETLKDLLQSPDDLQITFLNVQKFLNPHYVKEPAPEKKPRAVKVVDPDAPVKEKKARPKVVKPVVEA